MLRKGILRMTDFKLLEELFRDGQYKGLGLNYLNHLMVPDSPKLIPKCH